MQPIIKSNLAIAAIAAVTLTGCSSKMKNMKAEYFSCNPTPLEVVGQNVPATVTGRIPAKYFVKNAQLTVVPVLSFKEGKVTGEPVTFQGENVRGNNSVISYKNGGVMTVPVDFAYQPEMQKSELSLDFTVDQKGKKYVLPSVKVADGVNATAALASAESVNPATAPDKYQKVVNEKYKADLLFLINQSNLRSSETSSADMKAFRSDLQKASRDTSRVIEEVNISSYASPEGDYDFNNALAEKREETTKKYLASDLKQNKISNFGELTAQFTPEDWEGFQELVAASNIQDKELILSVLSMYKDPAEREKEIRNMSSVFDQLAQTILPKLRRSKLTASVNVIGRSDEQINAQFDKDPSALSIDELLYAVNLTKDDARKKAILETAARQYPQDFRTYNNLARLAYMNGDYQAAKNYLAQARALNASAPEVSMNEGLLDMVAGDFNAAQQKLGQAGSLPEASEALGTYWLMNGDLNRAVNAFGNTKSNNAALAQILNKNYSQAQSILSDIEPDPTTFYLMAIVGARTNNASKVVSNLTKAVKLNPDFASRIANDMEFKAFDLSSVLN